MIRPRRVERRGMSAEEIPGSSRRKGPTYLLLATLLVGGGVTAWKMHQPVVPVYDFASAEITRGKVVATVSATGSLEATTTVVVGSQVSAPVKTVVADFNTQVHKGDVLATLDPSEFLAQLNQSKAGLDLARAGLENARAKVLGSRTALDKTRTALESSRSAYERMVSLIDSARSQAETANSQVAGSKAQMDVNLVAYKRDEQLFQRQLIAASDRDTARATYLVSVSTYRGNLAALQGARAAQKQSVASMEGARDAIASAQADVASSQSDLKAALSQVHSNEAQVKQAQALINQQQVNVERCVIRSPISGTVIERMVDPGQVVAATYTAPQFFRVARDLHNMQVRADVSEADIGQLRLGQKVTFTVDAYPNEKFHGTVKQVRSAPATPVGTSSSNNVVVYGVLISAPNPKLLLKPGMTATVSIATSELDHVLLVPDEALRFLPPNPPDPKEEKKKRDRIEATSGKKKDELAGRPGVVWVAGPDKAPERRDIVLGVGDGKVSQLLDGNLKEHDKVYTKILDDDANKKKGFKISF